MEKFCPMLGEDCISKHCAWYDRVRDCCSLVSFSDRLWDISEELKELTHASTSKS